VSSVTANQPLVAATWRASCQHGPLRHRWTELIDGIDPDGPTGPAFAQADHTDHVHIGYKG
jgi:hypothetical protein